MYLITDYTKQKAKQLNVEVKPSKRKNKKVDVYKNDEYILSVGDINYKDYPTYLNEKGKTYADKRRDLYKLRHKKNLSKIGSKGYYADKLLW